MPRLELEQRYTLASFNKIANIWIIVAIFGTQVLAGLSIRSLRVFDAILVSGTLGGAAKLLNTSISAASRQLLELERDIGMNLFERTNRTLRPTSAGIRFHAEIQPILQGLNDLPNVVDAIKSEERQTISIISMPRLSLGILGPVLAKFSKVAPDVHLISAVLRRHDIQRWAASRAFDIGLGVLPISHRYLKASPVAELRAAILVREDHPLSTRPRVEPDDWRGKAMIGYQHGLVARDQMDKILELSDAPPRLVAETTSALLACQMAVNGIGAAVVDYATASTFLAAPGMKLIPIVPETWIRIGTFTQVFESGPRRFNDLVTTALEDTMIEFEESIGVNFIRRI